MGEARKFIFERGEGGKVSVLTDGVVTDEFWRDLPNDETPAVAFLNGARDYCSDHDPPLIITSVTPLAIQARPARSEVERVRARYSGDRLVSREDFAQLIEDADAADRVAELSAEAADVERDQQREAEAAESSDLRRESWISARVGQLERKRMSRSVALRQARGEADAMTFPSRFEFPYTAGASALSEPPTWHKTREEAEAWIGEQGPGSYYLNGPDEAPSQGVAATTAIRHEGEPDEREHAILTLAFRHCQDRDDLPDVVAIERVMALAMIAADYVSTVDAGWSDPTKLRAAEARLMRQIKPFLPSGELDG